MPRHDDLLVALVRRVHDGVQGLGRGAAVVARPVARRSEGVGGAAALTTAAATVVIFHTHGGAADEREAAQHVRLDAPTAERVRLLLLLAATADSRRCAAVYRLPVGVDF